MAGLLGDPAPGVEGEGGFRFSWGQLHAENAERPEDDPQSLFVEACLRGLRARLCDDVDSLDGYLPPQVAELARKVAAMLEEPEPASVV